MAAFSLAPRLGGANVTGLPWKQVGLMRQMAWIHPDQAKSALTSRISAGTIFDTAGRHGTYRTARRYSHCRSWVGGRVPRWCGAHLAADHLAPYAERLAAVRVLTTESH